MGPRGYACSGTDSERSAERERNPNSGSESERSVGSRSEARKELRTALGRNEQMEPSVSPDLPIRSHSISSPYGCLFIDVFPDMPCMKGFTQTKRRRPTGQQPGRKSARGPADKPRINRGQTCCQPVVNR